MRIALGGIYHETNTFAAGTTSLEDFHAYHYAAGEHVLDYAPTRTEIGGFISESRRHGWELVPSLFAVALPSGVVEHAVFDDLTERLLGGFRAAGRPDGVLLCLHGAMATSENPDADGEIISRLRRELGDDVPVMTTLDFHANTSDAMAEAADALVGYDTYPHVDMYERGAEAVALLAETLSTGRRRHAVHRKVALLTAPQVQYTHVAPMQSIMDEAHRLESASGVLVTVTPGFPYAEVDCIGLSVVTSAADAAAAEQVADELATFVAARADDFTFAAYSVEEGVARARSAEGPVALVDSADNIGGGSPGDGTAILEEWLRQGGRGLVVVIADPDAVAKAFASGVGAITHLEVGGKTDSHHGTPVQITGSVRLMSDGRYVHRGSYATGFETRMGRTAVIDANGNTVVLTERKVMPFDSQQLLSVGVVPAYCQAFVVKSAVAWRAAYGDYAREVVEVDTPGICTANLHRLGVFESRAEMIRPRTIEAPAPEGADGGR